MSKEFNQSLYEASLKALQENGVPEDLANKASTVIASDDAAKSDLGRSDGDRSIINQIMPYLQGDKSNE